MSENVYELRGAGLWSPDEIFDSAKALWRETVAASDADAFTRLDSPALAQYCLHVVLLRLVNLELKEGGLLPNGKASPWIAVDSTQTAGMIWLSSRLGLNQQSRFYRQKKREALEAAPPIDRAELSARFAAIEARLTEQEDALRVLEGVHASVEATRQDLEDLCLHLLGEGE